MRKKRTVELFRINWTATNPEQGDVSFEYFLENYADGYSIEEAGKNIYLKIQRTRDNYIAGSISTTKKYGIPPKNNASSHVSSGLDMDEDEGLGYSNVFLYDITYRVLYYEFNLNGCWIKRFFEFLNSCNDSLEDSFDIDIQERVVLRQNAYERLRSCSSFTKIHLKVAFPNQMIFQNRAENDSMENVIRSAAQHETDTLEMILNVDSRRLGATLNPGRIGNDIRWFTNQLRGPNAAHYTKIEVTGVSTDEESNVQRRDPIDLANDKFKRHFEIDEPRILTDLQIREKTSGIIDVYNRCLPEVRLIFR
ncbi:hypothetical protein OU798_04420 [Prolixibacteraceae bacterium Z1-6]|uniref:Uncharacterized protein n=1 Tax=Draconibacterium aestuarii TaxID=2998507 RepID=A0A9X3F2X0_9BACT|nr:hypothetical protein [Prolixibacteraceae bacterium Z1-6]